MKKIIFYVITFLLVGFIGFSLMYYPSAGEDAGVAPYLYAIWAVATAVISVPLCILEAKTSFIEKTGRAAAKNSKAILITALMIAVSAAIAAIVELLLGRFVFEPTSTGGYFNKYRYYFFVSVGFLLCYILYHYKTGTQKAENLFAAIALAAGIVMIVSSPAGHTCWDIESHYRMALGESSINANITKAEELILDVSKVYWPRGSKAENEEINEIMNEQDKIPAGKTSHSLSLAHLPVAIVLSTGRILGLSFHTKECIAKLVNLLLYTILIYFAIKKLKSGKIIFFVLALIPTNMFLAVNFTYDWWVNAFMMLGLACFISEAQQPNKVITPLETVIMCGALALACLPKQVYFPVLLLPFFMKKNYFEYKKKEKRRFYLICAVAIAFLLLSFFIRSVGEISKNGDMRGGEGINATEQIKFIFSSPVKYAGILLKFIWDYISLDNVCDAFCNFAYLGKAAGYTFLIILLISAVFTDKCEYDLYSSTKNNRWIIAVITVLCFALVPTALYVAFTTVGSEEIAGCQARYMMPMLITALPFVGSKRFRNNMNRQIYNTIYGLGSAAVLYTGIYQAMILRML